MALHYSNEVAAFEDGVLASRIVPERSGAWNQYEREIYKNYCGHHICGTKHSTSAAKTQVN